MRFGFINIDEAEPSGWLSVTVVTGVMAGTAPLLEIVIQAKFSTLSPVGIVCHPRFSPSI
jgi:hypothetical protein